ncbi:hypothetical protein PoB_007328000 [Plakobranchus ocellatus]|uniref:Uncharacterized protein n=1 Tax=Plakobranchus ocellatus TaxID=259542 RepID=A0AAV4DRZ8_9GAST|nr:hypothetical protein PoB_007328000 [Plakobranchus ocellatus]
MSPDLFNLYSEIILWRLDGISGLKVNGEKHKNRPEPLETELNEISPPYYTALNRPTVCVDQATAVKEVQSGLQPQNKDVDINVNDSTEAAHISHVQLSPAESAGRENTSDITTTEVSEREPRERKR